MNHKDRPVALQYTIRAFGSFFCNCRTVIPVLLGLPAPDGTKFLALWHSSKTIWWKKWSRINKFKITIQFKFCLPVYLYPSIHQFICPSNKLLIYKDTTPSKCGPNQCNSWLNRVRYLPPLELSPIREEYVAKMTPFFTRPFLFPLIFP